MSGTGAFGLFTAEHAETLNKGPAVARSTQSSLMYLMDTIPGTARVRASQVNANYLQYTPPGTAKVRVSQVCATVLIPSDPRVRFPLFPSPPGGPPDTPNLIGLSYTVFKRPVMNSGHYQAPSGREVRVNYYDATIWQWDLHYEYLPNDQTGRHPGTTDSDFHTMVSFFLETRGGQMPFTFWDPDDNTVAGTRIGVTDGVKQYWVVTREYGGQWKEVEPVGYMRFQELTPYNVPWGTIPDPPNTPVLYLDHVPQSMLTYDIIRDELGKQLIRFHTPPAAGQVITMDFQYSFFTRFADLQYEFEEFVWQVWSAQKITLESMRSYIGFTLDE